jgi:RND family efflux transporter MFP subunit
MTIAPRIRLAAVSLVLALAACGPSPQQQQAAGAPPPPPVTVAKPVERGVVDHDEYVGRFVAVDSVEVRARVSGYLEKVHFRDGQMVKEGDLLFTIDRRPFQNALDQARANLAQARANLAFAEADLSRGQQLVRDRTITEQTFDQRTQAQRAALASVAANEAQVRQAELDLTFTELRAPVAGRIGDRRVSPGNLVTGGALATGTTLLATIVSLDPIRFEFTMDEASYLRYERFSGSGKEVTGREGGVAVMLKLIDENEYVHRGTMDFVDNAIDKSSGTIRGRAVFRNPEAVLTPGMFGRIRVPGSPVYQALLVPDAAIGTEQTRKFVLVVGEDNVAAAKYVTLGPVVEDKLRIVKSGLKPDDRVVVNGLMRARAGQKVTPQEQAATAAPASAVGAGSQAKAQ